MRGRIRNIGGVLVVALLMLGGCATGDASNPTASGEGPPLKYQDGKGPPCMCTGGLSESDIQQDGKGGARP